MLIDVTDFEDPNRFHTIIIQQGEDDQVIRGTIYSQLLRFLRTNSHMHSFKSKASQFINSCLQQGTPPQVINQAVKLFKTNKMITLDW